MATKNKWTKIGNVIKSKEGDGNYLKLVETLTVMKNGEELETNKSRTCQIKMVENDKIKLAEILVKNEKIAEIRRGFEGKPSFIRFEKDVSFKLGATPVKTNKNNIAQLQDPVKATERMIKFGIIKEEDAERRREQVQQTVSWLQYEVVIPSDDSTPTAAPTT